MKVIEKQTKQIETQMGFSTTRHKPGNIKNVLIVRPFLCKSITHFKTLTV